MLGLGDISFKKIIAGDWKELLRIAGVSAANFSKWAWEVGGEKIPGWIKGLAAKIVQVAFDCLLGDNLSADCVLKSLGINPEGDFAKTISGGISAAVEKVSEIKSQLTSLLTGELVPAIKELIEQLIRGAFGKLCNLIKRLVDACDLATAFFAMLRNLFECVMKSVGCAAGKACEIVYNFLKRFWPVLLALVLKFLLGNLLDRIKSIICKVRCIVEKTLKGALDLVIQTLYTAFGKPKPGSKPPCKGDVCPTAKPCPDDDGSRQKPITKDTKCGERCKPKQAKPGNCFAEGTLVHTPSGTQAIQTLRVGQRVITFLPHERRGEAPPEPAPAEWAAHRLITLTLPYENDEFIRLQLLRDPDWFRAHSPEVGGWIYLEMPEMGVHGEASVDSIAPCPPIEPGEGRVITATFHHSVGKCHNLKIGSEGSPIGVTDLHPFWSVDRNKWATTIDLQIGEAVKTLPGATIVESRTRREESEAVYNIEVEGDHCYRVSESGALVHNVSELRADGCCGDFNSVGGAKGGGPAPRTGVLVRRGSSVESRGRLERQAQMAEAAGKARNGVAYGHGVSVTSVKANNKLARDPSDRSTATKAAFEAAGFQVRYTPTRADCDHHTVQLPKPLTSADARKFNEILGRS